MWWQRFIQKATVLILGWLGRFMLIVTIVGSKKHLWASYQSIVKTVLRSKMSKSDYNCIQYMFTQTQEPGDFLLAQL